MCLIIRSRQELRKCEAKVLAAVEATSAKFTGRSSKGLSLFRELKFGQQIGQHPLEHRPLNFVEQLNQTFTYLVTFRAVDQLFETHKNIRSYKLNLGTKSGFYVINNDWKLTLVAEVFAAVSPKNNDKLKKDIEKVAKSKAKHRYVFFFSPKFKSGRQRDMENCGVEVWSVEI